MKRDRELSPYDLNDVAEMHRRSRLRRCGKPDEDERARIERLAQMQAELMFGRE